jgi:hypothetical protein
MMQELGIGIFIGHRGNLSGLAAPNNSRNGDFAVHPAQISCREVALIIAQPHLGVYGAGAKSLSTVRS